MTLRRSVVLASYAQPGNSYDEHILRKPLLRYLESTGHIVRQAFVGRGYRISQSTEGPKSL